MADPAKDVPADRPLGRGDGGFDLGALGLGVSGTVGVGAVVELADHLHGAFERVQATIAVIADRHPPTADRAVAVEDVKFKASEIGARGPSIGHGTDLPDWDSVCMGKEHCEGRQDLQRLLACCSVIDFLSWVNATTKGLQIVGFEGIRSSNLTWRPAASRAMSACRSVGRRVSRNHPV